VKQFVVAEKKNPTNC